MHTRPSTHPPPPIPRPGNIAVPPVRPASSLARLLLRPEAARLRQGAWLSVAGALAWPVMAGLAALGIAQAVSPGTGLRPGVAAGGFLAVGVLRAGLFHLADRVLQQLSHDVVARLRRQFVLRESRSASPAELGGPAALAALAGDKLDLIGPALVRYQPARMRAMLIPPLLLALAFWQSWAVGVVLLAAGPLIPLFMALIGMAAQSASARQLERVGTLNDLLIDRLAAAADLRALGAADRACAELAAQARDLRVRAMAVLRIAFLSSTVLELFAALGVAMVAVWVGFSLLGAIGWGSWGTPLRPAAGIFLLLIVPEFFQPMRDLAAAWHDRAAAQAVAGEWAAWARPRNPALLGTGAAPPPTSPPALPPAPGLAPGPATLAWQGLALQRGGRTIRYPDAAIGPGETVAIVGPSGAGKTALLRLIAGLERPATGCIRVCGAPLDDDTADGWRARLGWLPQAPRFLDASLRANVTLGSGRDPWAALAMADAADIVAGRAGADQLRLGETGGGLSGGEARRVMLARAIHARPDVLLADEPTADLDGRTAARITEALLKLAAGGTTLVVATHDPALAARMGRVIRLEGAG